MSKQQAVPNNQVVNRFGMDKKKCAILQHLGNNLWFASWE